MTTQDIRGNGDSDLPSQSRSALPGLQFTTNLSVPSAGSACPAEYADVPIRELFGQIDSDRQQRAADAADESLAAGFRPRSASSPPPSGSGFESGAVLDTSAPSGSLAGLTDAARH